MDLARRLAWRAHGGIGSVPLGILVMLGIVVLSPGMATAQDDAPPIPEDVLIFHGINPTIESVLEYLQNGFSEEALTRGLPDEPRDKTQIVVYAIQLLGDKRALSAVDLLIQICREEFPPGVRQAFRIDLQGIDALLSAPRAERLREVVVYNSMVALGWIGDERAIDVVKELLEKKTPTRYVTQGALALAMMGDTSGIPKLLDLMESGTPAGQAGAARVFYVITGRYYDLNIEASVARRKAILADARLWYADAGSGLGVIPAEVRVRRMSAYPPNPQPPDMETVRGLCRTAVQIVTNYRVSLAARRKLQDYGPEAKADLEAVARDVMEDNDVRLEALRHYVRIAGKDSKGLLKQLAKDQNRPVAERAKYVIDNLEQYTERGMLPE